MARAHFPVSALSDLAQDEAVVDLRETSYSSTSSQEADFGGNDSARERKQPNEYDGDFGENYTEHENIGDVANTLLHSEVSSLDDTGASMLHERKLRQRFGPDEDYLLAIQVNADAPYAAKQGEINKQWQLVADKLNSSPNFCMKNVKGVTAKARFKTLLARHRAWEATSAKKSGTNEAEIPFIRVMTEVLACVDDYEANAAQDAAIKKGEQRAKEQSGEVVRQAAVARINLGKRRSRTDEIDTEVKGGEPSPVQLRPSNRARSSAEWVVIYEESKRERSKALQDFLQQQQSDLRLRLEFEKQEREKDRAEREREREERRMDREERQQERSAQAKLLECILERLTKKHD